MTQTATNPETGERLVLLNGEWQPFTQSATGPGGEKAFLVGGKWASEKALPTAPAVPKPPTEPDDAEMLAGSVPARFALGAASPVLGLIQLGQEAAGSSRMSEHLERLEGMKSRGMSSAAEIRRLREGRAKLEKLPGYETAIADIDRKIAELGKEDPNASGFDLAGLAGAVASPAVLGLAKLPTAATKLGRAGQAVGIGAAAGATAPVTSGEGFWGEKGVQTGLGAGLGLATHGLLGPTIRAGQWIHEKGRKLIDPLTSGHTNRSAREIVAASLKAGTPEQQAEAQRLMRENARFVPGSNPSAAEAAAPAGIAELSGLQKLAEGVEGTKWDSLRLAQEGSRQSHLERFARNPESLAAAVEARADAADPLYASARRGGPIPGLGDPFTRARGLAPQLTTGKVRNVVDPTDVVRFLNREIRNNSGNPAVTAALKQIRGGLVDEVKTPEGIITIVKKDPKQLASSIDYVKYLLDHKDYGFLRKELTEVKGRLMAKMNPTYHQAEAEFAKHSPPVGDMEVGQDLLRALRNPLGGERPTAFGNAARKVGEREFPVSEDAQTRILNVVDDLSRKARHEELAGVGQQTAKETATPQTLPGGLLWRPWTVTRSAHHELARKAGKRTMVRVSEALRSPEETLKLLADLPPEQRRSAIAEILASQKFGRGLTVGATLGGSRISQEGE